MRLVQIGDSTDPTPTIIHSGVFYGDHIGADIVKTLYVSWVANSKNGMKIEEPYT